MNILFLIGLGLTGIGIFFLIKSFSEKKKKNLSTYQIFLSLSICILVIGVSILIFSFFPKIKVFTPKVSLEKPYLSLKRPSQTFGSFRLTRFIPRNTTKPKTYLIRNLKRPIQQLGWEQDGPYFLKVENQKLIGKKGKTVSQNLDKILSIIQNNANIYSYKKQGL